jgi:hypothetical protein
LINTVLAQDTHFHIPERDTPFSKAIMNRWPGVLWCRIRCEIKKEFGYVFPARFPWVAKIPTKAGKVIAWRNGGDKGDYNFLIYVVATKEFHPRPNVRDVIDLIEMIDSPEDAVLFVGRPIGKRNKVYLEKVLGRGRDNASIL